MVEQNFDTNTGATISVEGEGVLSGDGAEVDLDISSERIDAGASAGNLYINKLESIRDELDNADDTGTTLGKMVAAQLKMTEAEIEYMVRAGIPKKASASVQAAAQDVKKAAG